MNATELSFSMLKNFYTKEDFDFNTTQEILPIQQIIGQEQALNILSFGMSIKNHNYNIFVSGLPHTGKKTSVTQTICSLYEDNKLNQPKDLCYVYNFKNPTVVKSMLIPAGTGLNLQKDMDNIIFLFSKKIPKLLCSIEIEQKKRSIIDKFEIEKNRILDKIHFIADNNNCLLKLTNSGIYFLPLLNSSPLTQQNYDDLEYSKKKIINNSILYVEDTINSFVKKLNESELSTKNEIENVDFTEVLFFIGYHLNLLINKYNNNSITQYLLNVKEDILNNISFFNTNLDINNNILCRYKINLVVDNSKFINKPIINTLSLNDNISKLEISIKNTNTEYSFLNLKSNILQKSNDGYLLINAKDILYNISIYEKIKDISLKKKLYFDMILDNDEKIEITPIYANIKFIIIGSSDEYISLLNHDLQFNNFFKVHVPFEEEIQFNKNLLKPLISVIKYHIDYHKLLDFDYTAIIKLVEYMHTQVPHQQKISAQFNKLIDLLIEANFFAIKSKYSFVNAECVDKAIDIKNNMYNSEENRLINKFNAKLISINTKGNKIGEINSLALYSYGEYNFGSPIKVTATTFVGSQGILNIEKKSNLSGDIHNKGIEIIYGYIGKNYAQQFPLSFCCQICFEQNYSIIDGDSASITELYAIISSLTKIPLNQGIAVTGSMNQNGEVQAVGGITQKIESFFNLCNFRGLNGSQGVIIPYQNIKDLFLHQNLIEAVSSSMFHIYAINHIDEGIEILTNTNLTNIKNLLNKSLIDLNKKVNKPQY